MLFPLRILISAFLIYGLKVQLEAMGYGQVPVGFAGFNRKKAGFEDFLHCKILPQKGLCIHGISLHPTVISTLLEKLSF